MRPKLHSGYMEVAVADLIGWRTHSIVPNVSWGLGLNHECDLLIMDYKNRLTEVEIKISKSDLKADFKKRHKHESKIIGRLIYAVPDDLVECAKELIPATSGLISVSWSDAIGYNAKWVRICKHRKDVVPISDSEALQLLNLGCMRIWSLKRSLYIKIEKEK